MDDFPVPVASVTRTRPLGNLEIFDTAGGRLSDAKSGITFEIRLATRDKDPLCLNILIRNLPIL
ncbi:MAG: hypothetical protein NC824_03750 [Candidatus Omnitrophica bacterium]|nr:hypothetical protein [Candidatus Omnitrophota bacterium]